jgi:hypothetical protein
MKIVPLALRRLHHVTPGGRSFTLSRGEHWERFAGDTLWNDSWPIMFRGKQAGTLNCNTGYGLTAKGKPRWQASTRDLYWQHAADAPVGIGFDVAGLDSASECLAAFARKADEILDWAAGRPVPSIYAKSGVYQKGQSW